MNTEKVLKSFEFQDSLNTKIWEKENDSYKMRSEVRDRLLTIAEMFLDFLNIDAEGADFEILQSLDLNKYSPELICIEVIEKDLENSDVFNFLYKNRYKKIWSGVFSHIFKKIY